MLFRKEFSLNFNVTVKADPGLLRWLDKVALLIAGIPQDRIDAASAKLAGGESDLRKAVTDNPLP